MDIPCSQDPALSRFREEVAGIYGDRLERVVLFGSRARGDFRPDSDYDVAVFLRDMGDLWAELSALSGITTEILIDTGALISAKAFPAGTYRNPTAFMREIGRDGLDL